MLTALPIHIWDRELETRILIAALALHAKSDVILGHEYNISPLYTNISNIYHYGAGRPINVSPRTDQWYDPIIQNHGHVGLVYEEGINDIFSSIASDSFVGIDNQALNALTMQYGWCIEELKLIMSTIKDVNLRNIFASKYKIVGNPRFELQGNLGKNYFSEQTRGIINMFGQYMLISDNFGATQVYGGSKPISIERDVQQVANKKEAEQINRRYMDVVDQINTSKAQFVKIINYLVKQFPEITFLFRPHPLADCSQWYTDLVKSRNLVILMRDSIEPYIFGSMGLIHAGCTTGMQSELGSVSTIDLTRLFEDQRSEAASSLMATYRPSTAEELVSSIKDISKRNKDSKPKQTNQNQIKDILLDNLKSTRISHLNHCLKGKIQYPMSSALYTLHKEILNFNNETKGKASHEISDIVDNVIKLPPNPIKARTYTIDDMQNRLRRAFKSLKIDQIRIRIFKVAPNTFYFQRSK